MRFASSFVLSLVTAIPAAALPQTAVPAPLPGTSPTHIEVKAAATPLSEVLERISRQTGMKVTYEGGTPRTRVTTSLASVTPAQAVVSVMEGLGLNYLMGLDATSTRVETLLVVSPGSSSKTTAVARSSSAMPRISPPGEEMPEEPEVPEDDPMVGANMEAPPVDPNDPMGLGEGAANPALNPQAHVPGDQKQPQPFQPPVPSMPTGMGWSTPPGFSPPAGVPGPTNQAPVQPVPPPVPLPGAATPPPPNQ